MFHPRNRGIVQQSEALNFCSLFKLDLLIQLDIKTYSFYEVGLKKFFVFSSDKELIFIYINPQSERLQKNYDWDFLDNPIYCMCFEPSGTWVVIVSEQKILLVPFLPLFISQDVFDHKWSLSSVTVLPLANVIRPTSAVFWLTKESENILIIGLKSGGILFYSLETQTIAGECKVSGEINDLQMCFDDPLDILTLLITCNKSQQWKLVLEHRSFGYNWIQQIRAQNEKDKKDTFMSYIRQLSKDKITFFSQSGSKDENKSQTVEHLMKPTDYLPLFRKGGNNWALTAQYVNGRHFLTAFELNEGTMVLESPEQNTPSRTLRPIIKKDGLYIQGLWSPRLIYLLRNNEMEIHSTSFSVIQGDGLLETKREYTMLWSIVVFGKIRRAHLMTARDPPASPSGWQVPTFLSDLQLSRFSLEPCLLVTDCGAYILSTISDPCEWIVGLIMRGGSGAEQTAAGLGAPVSELLEAASDMLMSRAKVVPARYLYSLSRCSPDGWVARLGVFGHLNHLLTYKPLPNTGTLGHVAITVKILTTLHKMSTDPEEKVDLDVKFAILNSSELQELTWFAASVGLWQMVPVFSISRGNPGSIVSAMKYRKSMCRGAFNSLLTQRSLILLLLEGDEDWLFKFISDNCESFDTVILKCFCLWLNPLQDQLRPMIRDMKQGISSIYTSRMRLLIGTFMHVASAIEAREPCPDLYQEVKLIPETWKNHFTARCALSCGLTHWAVVHDGNAKIMTAKISVNTQLIGRVIDVACGRHHTLVLTENGIYSAGDNMFGQLGVGAAWGGVVGEATKAHGSLLHVSRRWTAPLVSVAAGHYHSAAVDLGGRLYTWGWGVHGQLGLGSIDDQWAPQLVPKFLGRKVVSVSCGACHTCVLVGGEVWVCGAGACGQLGAAGARTKASFPVRVHLKDHVRAITAGYFHNLALTDKGQVWVWGASPQQVRASAARRPPEPPSPNTRPPSPTPTSSNSPPEIPQELHLHPQLVDTSNVRGRIVKMAAGWHHSCIMNNVGTLYTWGLNFDGQLGSGDRKLIQIPTEVKIQTDSQPDTVKTSDERPVEVETDELKTNALVACGGDFTIYIDDDGRIYATGNALLKVNNDKDEGTSRIIMMKTTKRIIKIPATKSVNKFQFQQIDRVDIMLPSDVDRLQRNPLEPRVNPLVSVNDFKKKTWADYIIIILKQWLNEEDLNSSLNMRAKFAYHDEKYADCLKLLLDNSKREPPDDCFYVKHTIINNTDSDKGKTIPAGDVIKSATTAVISKRIKDMSMGILNDGEYVPVDPAIYKDLYCSCDELKYFKKVTDSSEPNVDTSEDLSTKTVKIIDKCISIFPINPELWEECFRISKNFYIENNLPIGDLECILSKYMESNATTMAAAIMFSNECSEYNEILSSKFYLNMCSQVLDTWG